MAIPTPIVRNLHEDGILRTMAIDLSEAPDDRAAIIEVLRSKLYANKVLAPIREYATNAADSHVEAGCPNRPIKVVLPTQISPELKIRDFGIGLSVEEIERIYIKYGRSTKRNTNSQTGQLGLGCKSAFAYGDNFNVVSYKDGVKTTYNLSISGVCSVMMAEPMEPDESNGIEVIVPVEQENIKEFQDQAIDFFKYWKICPDITGGDLDKLESLRNELAQNPIFYGDDWEVRPSEKSYYGYNVTNKGIAVMGNVPYPVDWSIISAKFWNGNSSTDDKLSVLFNFVKENKTILRFDIGSLDFSASRESLEYTDKTCKTIISKINTIFDKIFGLIDERIQNASDYWNALIIYNQIFGNDDEKIFQGDIRKLEKYFRGRVNYKGIVINSGYLEGFERWDLVCGHFKEDTGWSITNEKTLSYGVNNIFQSFHLRNGKVKKNKNYSWEQKIPAVNGVKILIQDMDKPVLVKSVIRWALEDKNYKHGSVYLFSFRDADQRTEFLKSSNFETVPVIYVSKIIDDVRAWLKSIRSVGGGTTQRSCSASDREPLPVRYIDTENQRKYGYFESLSWSSADIDLRETEGFYVPIRDGFAIVDGRPVNLLSHLSHHSNVLLKVLGENESKIIYGIPHRSVQAKWFEKATEDEQWVSIEDYFKKNEQTILLAKNALLSKSSKYYKAVGDVCFSIGTRFSKKILPLLKNKNGVMYKVCSEISVDFESTKELAEALDYFNLGHNLEDVCETDFQKLFGEVDKKYPLLSSVKWFHQIQSASSGCAIDDTYVKHIAEYVNLIDGE